MQSSTTLKFRHLSTGRSIFLMTAIFSIVHFIVHLLNSSTTSCLRVNNPVASFFLIKFQDLRPRPHEYVFIEYASVFTENGQSIRVHTIVFSENGTVDSRPHEYGHPTQYATKMVLRMCDLSRDIATAARASCSFRSFVSAILTFCTCAIFSKSVRSSCYSIILKRIKMS